VSKGNPKKSHTKSTLLIHDPLHMLTKWLQTCAAASSYMRSNPTLSLFLCLFLSLSLWRRQKCDLIRLIAYYCTYLNGAALELAHKGQIVCSENLGCIWLHGWTIWPTKNCICNSIHKVRHLCRTSGFTSFKPSISWLFCKNIVLAKNSISILVVPVLGMYYPNLEKDIDGADSNLACCGRMNNAIYFW
jgi:hypothetical protein